MWQDANKVDNLDSRRCREFGTFQVRSGERQDNLEIIKEIEQLKRDLVGVKAERDAIKLQREDELKSIAVKLGVPDTAEHIRNCIDENIKSEKAAVMAGETYRLKLSASERKISQLLQRGWWQRLRNVISWK
jgi:hypothetical protein